MMRQLSGGGQSHGLVEEASWRWWPFGGESSVQSSRGNRHDTIAGFRRNHSSSGLRTRQDTRITAMVSMVREVLPHVPDELIAQVCYGCFVILQSVKSSYPLKRVITILGQRTCQLYAFCYFGYYSWMYLPSCSFLAVFRKWWPIKSCDYCSRSTLTQSCLNCRTCSELILWLPLSITFYDWWWSDPLVHNLWEF